MIKELYRHRKGRPRWKGLQSSVIALFLPSTLFNCAPASGENQTPAAGPAPIYKVMCTNSLPGCACFTKSDSRTSVVDRLPHMLAVTTTGRREQGFLEIRHKSKLCWYPESRLEKSNYSSVLRSTWKDRLRHDLIPLEEFAKFSPATAREIPLGRFWPTYYHLALEDFHPGPSVPIRDPQGRVIGHASESFLRQVDWEGSGISSKGLRVQYAGRSGKYVLYSSRIWGHGAGHGYRVYPYRTIAVNWKGFCEALAPHSPYFRGACGKSKVIGLLVRITEVADAGIKMPGGHVHDGYFCATDTGSPNYIREDRIDIFVGVHGGGNPYLPPERRGNILYDAGIRSLVPWDWKLWTDEKTRVWCPRSRLPRDPFHPEQGDCTHDYHVSAREKSLRISAVFHADGSPARCEKDLKMLPPRAE